MPPGGDGLPESGEVRTHPALLRCNNSLDAPAPVSLGSAGRLLWVAYAGAITIIYNACVGSKMS